jgi:hypothetical protein
LSAELKLVATKTWVDEWMESLSQPKSDGDIHRLMLGGTTENRLYGGAAPRAIVGMVTVGDELGGAGGAGEGGAGGLTPASFLQLRFA